MLNGHAEHLAFGSLSGPLHILVPFALQGLIKDSWMVVHYEEVARSDVGSIFLCGLLEAGMSCLHDLRSQIGENVLCRYGIRLEGQ